jgi:hypothetical protein
LCISPIGLVLESITLEVGTQTKERKIIKDRIMHVHWNGENIYSIVVLSDSGRCSMLCTQWLFAPAPMPALLDLASVDVAAQPPSVSARGRTGMAGLACILLASAALTY